jgi:hypothetical protein
LPYRSITASWLFCCLLCSNHNKGTVVLIMGGKMMWWWWRWLCQQVCMFLVSFGASLHSLCGHILCIMYTTMVILF